MIVAQTCQYNSKCKRSRNKISGISSPLVWLCKYLDMCRIVSIIQLLKLYDCCLITLSELFTIPWCTFKKAQQPSTNARPFVFNAYASTQRCRQENIDGIVSTKNFVLFNRLLIFLHFGFKFPNHDKVSAREKKISSILYEVKHFHGFQIGMHKKKLVCL